MKNKISGVYALVNKITNKKFIGSSKNITYGCNTHLLKLINNTHWNHQLQNAFNKDGIENFYIEILETINNNNLIFREQFYLKKHKSENLYNSSNIVGSDKNILKRKKIYLIDLEGNIIKKFISGTQAADFFNCTNIDYRKINTKSIKLKKYRLVTPEFYENNMDIIKSWKPFSNKSKYKSREYKKHKYLVTNLKNTYTFNTYREVSEKLNISHQRVSQIFKMIKKSGEKKIFHKKSGFYLAFIKKKP